MNRQINKIGRKLGLYRSGKVVFGEYKGFNICLYSQSEIFGLRIKVDRSPDDGELQAIKEKYRCPRMNFDNDSQYLDIIIHYSKDKTINLIEDIVELCQRDKIKPLSSCDSCSTKGVGYYTFEDVPYILCSKCFSVESNKKFQLEKDYKNQETRYVKGLLGALLFSVIGFILLTLLSDYLTPFGWIPLFIYSFFTYASLSLSGFLRFKGKQTKKSGFLLIMMTLFMTFVGTTCSYYISKYFVLSFLFYKPGTLIDLTVGKWMFLDFFMKLGGVGSPVLLVFFSWRKSWKFNHFIKAERL